MGYTQTCIFVPFWLVVSMFVDVTLFLGAAGVWLNFITLNLATNVIIIIVLSAVLLAHIILLLVTVRKFSRKFQSMSIPNYVDDTLLVAFASGTLQYSVLTTLYVITLLMPSQVERGALREIALLFVNMTVFHLVLTVFAPLWAKGADGRRALAKN